MVDEKNWVSLKSALAYPFKSIQLNISMFINPRSLICLNSVISASEQALRVLAHRKIWVFTQNLKHRLMASYVPPGDNQ